MMCGLGYSYLPRLGTGVSSTTASATAAASAAASGSVTAALFRVAQPVKVPKPRPDQDIGAEKRDREAEFLICRCNPEPVGAIFSSGQRIASRSCALIKVSKQITDECRGDQEDGKQVDRAAARGANHPFPAAKDEQHEERQD